ncbi:MAG: methionyl-tRNA formyltransferase [Chitinophagales bacterium]|nr:methionyl-tRNA formyltransferase [Chitinophagales bacterium]
MGTPEFAVPSLSILHQNGYEIAAVVTAPDKPAGRGYHLQASPIKRYAQAHGLMVLQPEKLRDATFLAQLRDLAADLQVVVAFRMLPSLVFSMPRLGCINLHASLLPQYRGAAPINWAIIRGETETGLTTFYIEQEIDKGNMIAQTRLSIGINETAGELHDRLMVQGAQLLLETVRAIANGTAQGQAQTQSKDLRAAPKIFTDTCRINWAQNAADIHNFVRGMSPYPAAFTLLNGQNLKILRSTLIPPDAKVSSPMPPAGTLHSDGKKYIHVATADTWIALQEVQPSGKRPMTIADFLNGYKGNLVQFE